MRFAEAAARLSGAAGVAFGWTPDTFWNATPAELGALVRAFAGEDAAPLGDGELARLGNSPGGDWAGHAHEIAGWTSSGWIFVQPREGMQLWIGSTAGVALFTGGAWRLGELHGKLFVEGDQVVGSRGSAIVEPAGGSTVDAEARAVIASVLDALRAHGLIEGG
jgi:hypothetical protein